MDLKRKYVPPGARQDDQNDGKRKVQGLINR